MHKKVILFLMISTLCFSISACKKKDKDSKSTETTQEVTTEEGSTFESNMESTESSDDYGWDDNQDPNSPPTTPYTVPPVEEIMVGDRKDSSQLSYDGTVVSFNVPQMLYSVEAKGTDNGVYEDFMYDSNNEEEKLNDWYITTSLNNEGCTSEEFMNDYKETNKSTVGDITINQYQAGGYTYNWVCNTYPSEDGAFVLFVATTDVGNKLYEITVVASEGDTVTPESIAEFFNITVN